ncbi:MAG TPA: DUF4124 domain-containing protein [Steroidobacteraceae bacterium]|nr:DUF4124 domain-containing protein [Steroidobacteraceae bacterium]
MRRVDWMLLACVALASPALLTSPALAAGPSSQSGAHKVYSWVDEDGVTHYGDRIPPEYAAQEHRVINAQGIEVDRTEAQRTPDQLAEEDKRKLDALQRADRDKNLLNTYVSVQEIEHLRDQRLNLLSDQIKVTTQFLEILNGKMNKLRIASSRFKPYSLQPDAPPMSDQLAEDLVRVGSDIRTQEENLRQKRSEEAAMSQQFESDIERFKELKGIH